MQFLKVSINVTMGIAHIQPRFVMGWISVVMNQMKEIATTISVSRISLNVQHQMRNINHFVSQVTEGVIR